MAIGMDQLIDTFDKGSVASIFFEYGPRDSSGKEKNGYVTEFAFGVSYVMRW